MNINVLTTQAITGKYSAHGDIKDGNCVIGFSFGYQKINEEITPGISNEDIAGFIEKNVKVKPLILQFEIANAFKLDQTIFKITQHRKKGEYLDTSEVAKQAQMEMIKNGWNKAIIVAHPFHMPRVDAICAKLGIKTIAPSGLESIRFDPNSYQEWTQSKKKWIKKEIKAIQLSVKLGLI